MIDLEASLFGTVSAVLVVASYRSRVAVYGPYASARVAQEGSSMLLAGWAMSAVHWALEPIGRACVRAGITANQVTGGSLVLGAAAGVAIGAGHFGLGGTLAAVAALGDTLDGIVARTAGSSSEKGELFDSVVDRYTEFFFLAGVIFAARDRTALLLLALGAVLASFMVSYSTAKAEALHVTPPRGSMRRSERATYLIVSAMLAPIVNAVLPGTAWVPIGLSLGLVAVVGNISAVRRLASIMTQVDRSQGPAR